MIPCWYCKTPIDQTDNYCRYCGKGQGKRIPFYYRHWGVWFLFLFIGPFNLWFIYRSPLISKRWKLIDTALILFVSAWFFWLFYRAVSNITNMYTTLLTGNF
ncbi:MAG: zinc ribbon domain-containing protein [Elusimicrobiota bacterium]|nr:zinc ribbon domain-containing protein [Elusimicrobiota bacterium]